MNRREFLRFTLGAGSLMAAGAFGHSVIRTGDACRAAERFLASRQSADGAWRSTHYGAFRDGDALTPLILWALAGMDSPIINRGQQWLEKLTDEHAKHPEPWKGLAYPLFTASYAYQFLQGPENRTRVTFWYRIVRELSGKYGVWSDSPVPPVSHLGDSKTPDMLAANISATLLGFRGAPTQGWNAMSTAYFATACQNRSWEEPQGEFDDGGCFFAPNDPIRNKAGVAGVDAKGITRFRSYGSATCDAYLLLIPANQADALSGLAALGWLRRHADGLKHAGDWPADRTDDRDSLIYYYAQSFADVLATLPDDPWAKEQRRKLTDDLLERQASDGSWAGLASASCEDDPLLATAFALHALRVCG